MNQTWENAKKNLILGLILGHLFPNVGPNFLSGFYLY